MRKRNRYVKTRGTKNNKNLEYDQDFKNMYFHMFLRGHMEK